MGGGVAVVAGHGGVVPAEGVDGDEDDVGRVFWGGLDLVGGDGFDVGITGGGAGGGGGGDGGDLGGWRFVVGQEIGSLAGGVGFLGDRGGLVGGGGLGPGVTGE